MKHISKIKISVFILILAYFLTSCATQTITIESPGKSENVLPEHIQSVLLISRVVDNTYDNLSSDSLQNIFYLKNFQYDTIVNDFMAVDTTIKVLGDILFESGRYDYVIPVKRFLKANKDSLLAPQLEWDAVKYLCEMYKTDALISLDLFETKVSIDIRKEINFYQTSAITSVEEDIERAFINIGYEAQIRVYDPLKRKITNKVLTDTLYWEDSDRSIVNLFEKFTTVKNALIETGIAVAIEFSELITPVWETEKRELFVHGDSRFRDAFSLVNENKWDQAMKVWNSILEQTNSKKIKSMAEFNIALAYELQGDLDQAIEWALKSYETMYRNNTYNYLEVLNERKINL